LFKRCKVGHGSRLSAKGRRLWPPRGQNVKQKAGIQRVLLNPFQLALD
jgi:hypothetical protein